VARRKLAGLSCDLDLAAGDFFARAPAEVGEVDAVVGNPPFIRYKRFDHASRSLALVSALKVGVRLQRLTSIWAPFLLHAIQFLRPGGDLAMVVPAEITQTHYGLPTLRALSERCAEVRLVAFEQNIFREAHTETCLLLARDFGGRCGAVRLVPLRNAAELRMVLVSGEAEEVGEVALDFNAVESRFIEAFLSPAKGMPGPGSRRIPV
jgi:adenine-specific DNA-methyltransferase